MAALKKEQSFSDRLVDEVLALKQDFENSSDSTEEHKTISFWVPVSYIKKYEQLQDVSKKKFGKKLKAAFIRAIDAGIE